MSHDCVCATCSLQSKVSTAELTGFSGKHWGSELPNYFQTLLAASLQQGLCLLEAQHSSMVGVLKALIDFTFGLAAESLLSRSPSPSSCYCSEPARMWFEFLPWRKTPFLLPRCHLSLELNLGEMKRRPDFHGVTTSPLKAMTGAP